MQHYLDKMQVYTNGIVDPIPYQFGLWKEAGATEMSILGWCVCVCVVFSKKKKN